MVQNIKPIPYCCKENVMLRWALLFLIVALVAAAMGFSGVAGEAAYFARILFFVFLVLFLISMVLGRNPPGDAIP
jgi:uncharacterized membrane protein YtjA (UPF0391 family)